MVFNFEKLTCTVIEKLRKFHLMLTTIGHTCICTNASSLLLLFGYFLCRDYLLHCVQKEELRSGLWNQHLTSIHIVHINYWQNCWKMTKICGDNVNKICQSLTKMLENDQDMWMKCKYLYICVRDFGRSIW